MYCYNYNQEHEKINKWPLWNMFGIDTFQNYKHTPNGHQVGMLSTLKSVICYKCNQKGFITFVWIPKLYMKIICYNYKCMTEHKFKW